jgi:hypothetical protein
MYDAASEVPAPVEDCKVKWFAKQLDALVHTWLHGDEASQHSLNANGESAATIFVRWSGLLKVVGALPGLQHRVAAVLTLMETTATILPNTARWRGREADNRICALFTNAAGACKGSLQGFFPALARVLRKEGACDFVYVSALGFSLFMWVSSVVRGIIKKVWMCTVLT